MNFIPLSEEELNPYQPGKYYFEVIDAVEKKSKANNDMLQLELRIEFTSGAHLDIKDYLPVNLVWKLSAFCKSINEEGLYKSGSIQPYHLKGKRGFCEIAYEENSETGKKYLKITKYLLTPDVAMASDSAPEPFNDNIPF